MDEDLRKYLIGMEDRITGRVGELEARIGGQMNELEARIGGQMNELEARINRRINERCELVETKLLTAFHGWSRSMESRVRTTASITMTFDERLALAEDRIAELERRRNLPQ